MKKFAVFCKKLVLKIAQHRVFMFSWLRRNNKRKSLRERVAHIGTLQPRQTDVDLRHSLAQRLERAMGLANVADRRRYLLEVLEHHADEPFLHFVAKQL
jgi:hypothetical protein